MLARQVEVNDALRARVAELEDDFSKRQAAHSCPAWDDQAGMCDCDERMGQRIAERDDARAEVERLTKENASLRHDADKEWGASATERARLESDNERLREALRVFASRPHSSLCYSPTTDGGMYGCTCNPEVRLARAALAGSPVERKEEP